MFLVVSQVDTDFRFGYLIAPTCMIVLSAIRLPTSGTAVLVEPLVACMILVSDEVRSELVVSGLELVVVFSNGLCKT